MNKFSLSALVAAGLLAGAAITPASAADLGGDCCADLEERIAELEATTVRKGNRKVSLTVSGFVAQQLLAWDDGFEDNIYITDTGSVSIGTHFAFTGRARINSDVSAGFVLRLEVMNNDSLGVNQVTDEGGNAFAGTQGGGPISVESAYWFLKSEKYGRVSLGQQSSAADNQAILPDGSGSLVQANYVFYDVNSFFLRRRGVNNVAAGLANSTALTWGSVSDCVTVGGAVAADCDGYPNNNVRYDTPTIRGFSASVSWGEDDVFSTSGRYAGELGDFKLAGAIAYTNRTDETIFQPAAVANGGLDTGHLQLGAYIQHNPTGLFVYGAYGTEFVDRSGTARAVASGVEKPEGDNWYIKPGLRRKFNPLGHSVFYFEYGKNEDKFTSALYEAGVNSSELEQYGLGFVQEIDAAAMSVWVSWRHYEAEASCTDVAAGSCAGFGLNNGTITSDFEDLDIVKFGALINF